ncbi:MAG: family 16 glycosylhydrolase [Bacteroidota bacterium]
MRNRSVLKLTGVLLFLGVLLPAAALAQVTYELVWAEEFDGPEIDRNTWNFWDGTAFNNELQYYTDRAENAFIEDGVLHIVGQTENFGGQQYTSARLDTRFNQFFTYGRFEARAKMPIGQGLWPAIWMMHNQELYGGWPYSGEIDIMEYRGNEPNTVHGTVHYASRPASPGSNALADRRFRGDAFQLPSGTFNDEFHVFAVEWDETGIRWFMDDEQYHEISIASLGDADPYPFNHDFYMILNLAIGGDFLPNPVPGVVFSETMLVDYVRIYQNANAAPVANLAVAEDRVDTGVPVALVADATDDGAVDSVAFFVDNTLIHTDREAPFAYDWLATDGCYAVSALAYDDAGRISPRVAPTEVIVGSGCRLRSFDGAIPIPGVIDLTRYDQGGQNVAYFDTTPLVNLGNAEGNDWRPNEGVDIVPIAGEAGAYAIGNIEGGEWTQYLLDVEETAEYDITLRAASPNRRASVTLSTRGDRITSFSRLPGAEASQPFTEETRENIELAAGRYRVQVDFGLEGILAHQLVITRATSTSVEETEQPARAVLHPAYPNPFNPQTVIRYELASAAMVTAEVFDALGRRVRTLVNGMPRAAGAHQLTFDAANLPSGLYTLVLTTPSDRLTQRLTLAK